MSTCKASTPFSRKRTKKLLSIKRATAGEKFFASFLQKRRACLALLLLVPACTAQLAPEYDKSIVDGLATANTDMQALFATVDQGVDASTYQAARAAAYNRLIGELRALELSATSRPTPPNDLLATVNQSLKARGQPSLAADPKFTDYPSARAMEDAADTITHMRDADRTAGLHGALIQAFTNQAQIYMAQAMTYENFLKR
jgi:hypothetical protein